MRRMLWLALLVVAALTLAAGCGGDDGEGSGAGEAADTAQGTVEGAGPSGEPIKIGTSLPLTGELSEPGKEAERGYRVWEKLTNEGDGLLGRPVELVIRDDASDQNTIVADYNALIANEKVDLLFGTFSSFLNLPASAVAERNQMLYVEPAGGSPEMFDRGFEFLFFAQQATAPHQADLFSEWVNSLSDDEKPKTAAYVSLDDPFTEPVISGMREQLEPTGVETVYNQIYPQGTSNFDTIANAIKSSGADLVAHGATSLPDGAGLVRALIRVGYSPQQFFQTTAPGLEKQYADAVGAENTEGVFFAVSYDEELETPGNDEFVATYKEMFGGDTPAEDAADAYATAQVTQAAVEAIGSLDDQRALADWLRENAVQTIIAELSWDEAGRPEQAFFLGQWSAGDPGIVLPEDQATKDEIVNPKPPWK